MAPNPGIVCCFPSTRSGSTLASFPSFWQARALRLARLTPAAGGAKQPGDTADGHLGPHTTTLGAAGGPKCARVYTPANNQVPGVLYRGVRRQDRRRLDQSRRRLNPSRRCLDPFSRCLDSSRRRLDPSRRCLDQSLAPVRPD